MKNCNKCDKIFYKSYNESRNAWSTRLYCSKSCANSVNSLGNKGCVGRIPWNKGLKFIQVTGTNNSRWSRIDLKCIECGKEFTVKNYRKNTAKFCSHNCEHKHRDFGLTTISQKIRHSSKYKQWRKSIFKRDNYTCQICQQRGGKLNADHIKPFALFPDLRLNLNNGRTLCVSCHKKTDTYGFRKITIIEEVYYGTTPI